jgi:hypothetical protein
MSRSPLAGLMLAALLPSPARAQPSLPPVPDVEWQPLREHCLHWLKGLQASKSPLPTETDRALRKLLNEKSPKDPDASAARVQKLLAPHCLVGVQINPEGRVKVARGPRRAALVRDRPTLVLVRVHNEAGVSNPLAVTGDHLVGAGKKGRGRWLEAEVLRGGPFPARLSGRRLEYCVLRLTARAAGKREATLRFDVGQGSEDLGFRAEVPILFHVRTR